MLNTLRPHKTRYESGPNLTPLVDVVMVVLIFLMLAGSFGGVSRFLVSRQGINNPGVFSSRVVRPGEPPEINLDIHVDNSRDGLGFVAQGTGISPTGDADKLRVMLDSRLRQFNDAGTRTDQLQVVLYPGRRVKYEYLIAIYQAALQAKFEKIAFATTH
jgi:biopolymer transport protein ExbD